MLSSVDVGRRTANAQQFLATTAGATCVGTRQTMAEFRNFVLAMITDKKVHDGVKRIFDALWKERGPLEDQIAESALIRGLINRLHDHRCGGIEHRVWRRVRKALADGFRSTGLERMPRRNEVRPSQEWKRLLAQIPNASKRHAIRRFATWCTMHGIAPWSVRRDHFVAFIDDARETNVGDTRETNARDYLREISVELCGAWNEARENCVNWPSIKAECELKRLWYTPPLTDYPQRLRDQIDELIEAWLRGGPGTGSRCGLSGESVNDTLDMLRRFLHGLCDEGGFQPSSIISLEVALATDHVRLGLNFHLKRQDGRLTPALYNMACLLRRILRFQLKAPKAQLAAVTELVGKLNPKHKNVPKSVIELFLKFKSTNLLSRLDGLGEQILRRYEWRRSTTIKEGIEIRCALAVELLLSTAEARNTLSAVWIGREALPGHGYIAGDCYKPARGRMRDPVPLYETAARLLELYNRLGRPRRALASEWLFPGASAGPMNADVLGRQMTQFVQRELNERLTPSQLRYAVGAIYLLSTPDKLADSDKLEDVRRLLGHVSIVNTRRAFKALLQAASFEGFDRRMAARQGRVYGGGAAHV